MVPAQRCRGPIRALLLWAFAAFCTTGALGVEVPAFPVFAESPGKLAAERQAEAGELSRGISADSWEARKQRIARLDFTRLEALREAARRQQPGQARLNLFEDAEFGWTAVRTATTASGYALSGPLTGVEDGSATLVVNGDIVVGSAWTPEAAYRIHTVGRRQIVERVETFQRSVCPGPLATEPAATDGLRSVHPVATNVAEDDGSQIDVLVVYTPEARRRAGGHRAMLADVDHDVAWTNEAYAASGVVHRVRLVGASEVEYEQLDGGTDARRLVRQGDGHLDEVHQLRDLLAADVVVFKTTEAPVYLQLSSLDAAVSSKEAFAFVQVDGGARQFAHQLGHVLGVNHARSEEISPNFPFPYSHGYELPDLRDDRGLPYQTIMAVGPGLPRFSNARQRFLGTPLGVPGDEPTQSIDGPADASRSMNETRHLVANYRRSATRCRYRLLAPTEVPAAGGTYMLRIEAGDGCAWTARGADNFTVVTGTASGVGDGAVVYRVPANDGWWREPALAVAGQMHVAAQPGVRPVRPVCDRTAGVRKAIEARLEADCEGIAATELAAITELDMRDVPLPEPGDFDGLSNLGSLTVAARTQGVLAAGVFDGLANLTRLRFWGYGTSLAPGSFLGLSNVFDVELVIYRASEDAADMPPHPPGTFEGLPRLRWLSLGDYSRATMAPGLFNGLSGVLNLVIYGTPTYLSAGTFRGLSNLRKLYLGSSATRSERPARGLTLEAGVFAGLPALAELRLSGLAELPVGAFSGLSAVRYLWLHNNAFTSLAPSVFEGLSSLDYLRLDNQTFYPPQQRLSTLPPRLFAGLPQLTRLRLFDVGLIDLDARTFDHLPELRQLDLRNNWLESLPPRVFDSLPQLHWVYLDRNRLTALPEGLFDNLPQLRSLYLSHNRLAALSPEVLRRSSLLTTLRLHGNRLTTLPSEFFVDVGTRARTYYGSHGPIRGLTDLTLHDNPGAPFALEVSPVLATNAWQRPARVAAQIAEGAPFAFDVAFDVASSALEAIAAPMAAGALQSDALAVRPAGSAPVILRVTNMPDAPRGAECADKVNAGESCDGGPFYTGIELVAGPALVLNGFADYSVLEETAHVDLANVFLEFDGSASLMFTTRTSDSAVAAAEPTGGVLRIVPVGPGTATITVTARAADGRTATRAFDVTVPGAEAVRLRGWRWKLLEGGN